MSREVDMNCAVGDGDCTELDKMSDKEQYLKLDYSIQRFSC
jgi:hypothetical protein